MGTHRIMAAILVFHGTLVALGQHRGQPRTMLVAWSIFAIHFGWKFGHTSMFAATMVAGCSLMLVHTDRFLDDKDNIKRNQTNSIVTYQLLVMSALLAIPALRERSIIRTHQCRMVPSRRTRCDDDGIHCPWNLVPLSPSCNEDGQVASSNTRYRLDDGLMLFTAFRSNFNC